MKVAESGPLHEVKRRQAVVRKNEMTFGRVPAESAWGRNEKHRRVVLNFDVAQTAVLAALCQRAVQEHYSFDRRSKVAKTAPVQLLVNYGDETPGVTVKRPRKHRPAQ